MGLYAVHCGSNSGPHGKSVFFEVMFTSMLCAKKEGIWTLLTSHAITSVQNKALAFQFANRCCLSRVYFTLFVELEPFIEIGNKGKRFILVLWKLHQKNLYRLTLLRCCTHEERERPYFVNIWNETVFLGCSFHSARMKRFPLFPISIDGSNSTNNVK